MNDSPRRSSGVEEKPFSVIVVEDDAESRAAIVTALSAHGWLVRAFSSAGPARRAALASVPDVVLTDFHLETLESGWELARALREEPAMRSVGLVALTGKKLEAAHLGPFDTYLLKPVDTNVLVRIVRERATLSRVQRYRAQQLR